VNKDLEGSSRDPVSDNTSVPAFACTQSRKSPEPKHSRCLGPKPAKAGPQYTSFNKQGDRERKRKTERRYKGNKRKRIKQIQDSERDWEE
jgi:hypothetical protein